MILARLCLAVCALSLASGGARAGDASPDRVQAVRQMQAWTRLPARAVVAVTPEMSVALLGRGQTGKIAGRLDGVELQGEVLDDAFAEARGWRSMRLKVDIACGDGGSTWVRRMTVYPGHDHAGAGREASIPVGWVRPKPEAYLGQVVDALCGQTPSVDAGTSSPAVAQAIQTPERAPPVLRPALQPSPAPSPPPTIAKPAAVATQSSIHGPMVQIAASPEEADAQRADRGPAASLIGADPALTFHTEPAISGGRKVYRALVSGFADRAAAERWCAGLRQAGGACFLR
jgi:hypothetical protein